MWARGLAPASRPTAICLSSLPKLWMQALSVQQQDQKSKKSAESFVAVPVTFVGTGSPLMGQKAWGEGLGQRLGPSMGQRTLGTETWGWVGTPALTARAFAPLQPADWPQVCANFFSVGSTSIRRDGGCRESRCNRDCLDTHVRQHWSSITWQSIGPTV